jgi:hypothetical protein
MVIPSWPVHDAYVSYRLHLNKRENEDMGDTEWANRKS